MDLSKGIQGESLFPEEDDEDQGSSGGSFPSILMDLPTFMSGGSCPLVLSDHPHDPWNFGDNSPPLETKKSLAFGSLLFVSVSFTKTCGVSPRTFSYPTPGSCLILSPLDPFTFVHHGDLPLAPFVRPHRFGFARWLASRRFGLPSLRSVARSAPRVLGSHRLGLTSSPVRLRTATHTRSIPPSPALPP